MDLSFADDLISGKDYGCGGVRLICQHIFKILPGGFVGHIIDGAKLVCDVVVSDDIFQRNVVLRHQGFYE